MKKPDHLEPKYLEIENFGRQLIVTGDLDPVYVALQALQGDRAQLARWLVAYWCFYHTGSACYLSELEGEEFWGNMWDAARNTTQAPTGDRWPRAAERRHFRGKAAMDAVSALQERWSEPEDIVHWLAGGDDGPGLDGEPFKLVYERALTLRNFGPWISFKIADMLDRCFGQRVLFDGAAIFMFKDPAAAVDLLWESRGGMVKAPVITLNSVKVKPLLAEKRRDKVVAHLQHEFRDLMAPPLRDRPVNIQEIETVLCKWKSHVHGRYPVGKDTHEVSEGLDVWAACGVLTARRMYQALAPCRDALVL